ncbi:MAG TPA: RNA polymerase sigma factor [Steroidobacteraceae bacterium]|nr:RNA polymerase sigma factor [Steroidobacteraceae bacterium]
MHWPSTGDADWEALYADHLPRIYNYFRFRLAGEADVEDLTARTFEKAWSARSRYRRDLAGFSTWLYRIAQNVCVDHLRSRRTRRSMPLPT